MATILERIRPATRTATHDAAEALADTSDAVARHAGDAVDAVVSGVDDVAGRVSHAIGSVGERLGALAEDARHEASRDGKRAMAELRDVIGRAGHEVDATLREARSAVADGLPIDEVVRRLERSWPGTDRDRYDRAYERGYARGRSGRLAVGLAVGAAAAASATYLFDPERGASRREALAARIRGVTDSIRQTVDARRAAVDDRTPVDASLRGMPTSPSDFGVAVGPGLAPDVTAPADASLDELAEVPSETDGRTPLAAGAVAATGRDAGRGDWHRDLEG